MSVVALHAIRPKADLTYGTEETPVHDRDTLVSVVAVSVRLSKKINTVANDVWRKAKECQRNGYEKYNNNLYFYESHAYIYISDFVLTLCTGKVYHKSAGTYYT